MTDKIKIITFVLRAENGDFAQSYDGLGLSGFGSFSQAYRWCEHDKDIAERTAIEFQDMFFGLANTKIKLKVQEVHSFIQSEEAE